MEHHAKPALLPFRIVYFLVGTDMFPHTLGSWLSQWEYLDTLMLSRAWSAGKYFSTERELGHLPRKPTGTRKSIKSCFCFLNGNVYSASAGVF